MHNKATRDVKACAFSLTKTEGVVDDSESGVLSKEASQREYLLGPNEILIMSFILAFRLSLHHLQRISMLDALAKVGATIRSSAISRENTHAARTPELEKNSTRLSTAIVI